jgi:hypothetical protein
MRINTFTQANQEYFSRSLLLVALSVGMATSGCNRPSSGQPPDASGPSGGFIAGQVFIVTRGAENVRLGQLKVCLVPREKFDELHVNERATAEITKLEQALATARSLADEREHLVSRIKEDYSVLLTQRDELVGRLSSAQLMHVKYGAAQEEIKRKDDLLGHFKSELERVAGDSYDECRRIMEARKLIPQALASATYDHLLPKSMISKTDADGRFRFECSPDRDYVIFTRGNRLTPSGSGERYEWFVSARPSRDEKRQVLLTNDNLIEGLAPENLMREVFVSKSYILEIIPSSQSRHLPDPKLLPSEPRWAPAGIYYLLTHHSVSTTTGVTGVAPGSPVKELRHAGDMYSVEFQNLVFDVPLGQLTDNADIARRLREVEDSAQTQIALWQKAQRDIEMQNKDAESSYYDERERRLRESYNRLHTLTGESRLNEPAHP